MSRINWGRVVVGGLAAGIVINVSGILLAHFVLGPAYVEAFKAKVSGQPEVLMLVKHVGLRLWFGVLIVFVYAGFRPRFGPGPRTAVLAGATVFLAAGLVLLAALNDFGLLSGAQLWIAAAWTLVENVVAGLAGAWVYREREPRLPTP